MAAPTDLLNEDVKELRLANQRVADRLDRLADEIHEFRNDFGEFRGRVETSMAVTRWAVVLAVPVAVAVIGAVISGSFYMGQVSNRLSQVEQQVKAPK